MVPNGINLSPDVSAVGSTLNSARHLIAHPGNLCQGDILNKLAGMVAMVNLWSDNINIVARNKVAHDIVFKFQFNIVKGWVEAKKIHPSVQPASFHEFCAFAKHIMDAKEALVGAPVPVPKKVPKAPVIIPFYLSYFLTTHSCLFNSITPTSPRPMLSPRMRWRLRSQQ
jgi:hypothetical protein